MNKKNIVFSILMVVLFVALLFPIYEAVAQKKSSILFVSPHRVTMTPKQKVQVLNIANHSDIPRRYDLQVIDQVMKPDGSTNQKDTGFKYSAKRILRFVPKRFTLEPGERQIVRVMARHKKDMEDGDYHSHILFKEVPLKNKNKDALMGAKTSQGTTFEIRAVYGVAVPIVVQHGKIETGMKLNSVSFVKDENGRRELLINVNRLGNSELAAKLSAVHVVAGKKPVDIVTEQWLRIYREVDVLKKRIKLSIPSNHNLSGGKVIVILKREDAEGNIISREKAEVSL